MPEVAQITQSAQGVLILEAISAGSVFMGANTYIGNGPNFMVKESTGGISGALSYRIIPSVFIGGELWYLRHYDGTWFNSFTGDAVFVGPTLYVQIAPKMFMTAAWNTQVAGHEVGGPGVFDLADFPRHRAKLKVALEF